MRRWQLHEAKARLSAQEYMGGTITVRLPCALATRLTAEAEREQCTISELVRKALDSYLSDARGAERTPSFLELAGDLAGCIAGPEDLSSGRKHLRHYGRRGRV